MHTTDETPEGVVITEAVWKGTVKTELFGLTKAPQRKGTRFAGYSAILLRDDAWAAVKQLAACAPSKRIGAKEILTAMVLVGTESDWNQAVMARAKSIAIEDLTHELETADAEHQ